MVGTHLHLASGVGAILHRAMLVFPAVVQLEGLGEVSRGGIFGDQVALVAAVRKCSPLH